MKRPYKIDSREEGRGPASRKSFATLAKARDYIRDYWQGADYIDGPDGFHTDYATFTLRGFTLSDIGQRRAVDWGFEWDWLTLDGDPVEEIDILDDDFHYIAPQAHEPRAVKVTPNDEPPF